MTMDPLAQYFAASGITDPDEIAYLRRNPDVAAQVQLFGADTARLHYQHHGQREGRPWGASVPAAAAPADPAAEAAKKAPPALPASYGTDAASWDAFRKDARMATEGINRMPGVFSDYGTIPSDKAMAREVFYPQAQQAAPAGAIGGGLVATPGGQTPEEMAARQKLFASLGISGYDE